MQFKLVHNYKHKPAEPDTKFEVKIECYQNRKYRYIDTGVYIETKYWQDGRISKKHPQYRVVDTLLQNKLNEYKNTALDHERTGNTFDFNALNVVSERKDTQLFYDFINAELKKEKNLGQDSVVKYRQNVRIVADALGNVCVRELTARHIEMLDRHFQENYSASMTHHLHIFVHKYVKKAVKQRLLQYDPYNDVELERFRGETRMTFLTLAELDKLERLEGLPFTIQSIRDRFLYSCYTGLRVSDNLALLKSNLTDTPDGYVVDLHTIKGYGHDLIHPLGLLFDGKPDRIARFWMTAHDEPTLFPKVSTTYIKEVLTILEHMAGLTKHLTFHVARHTCASLLADVSQNPFLIKNILGHSNINTSMIYIHASPESTKKQLRLLDGKWDNAR